MSAHQPGGEAHGDVDAPPGDIESRLRAALRDAMKARDLVAAFALRSAGILLTILDTR